MRAALRGWPQAGVLLTRSMPRRLEQGACRSDEPLPLWTSSERVVQLLAYACFPGRTQQSAIDWPGASAVSERLDPRSISVGPHWRHEDIAKRSSADLGLGDCPYQPRAPVAEHGLTVRYEHALDRQLDKRAQQLGKPRPGDMHIIQPGWWAHPQPPTLRADEPVPRDQCRDRRQPEHCLPRSPQRPRLDPGGNRVPRPSHGRLVAPGELLAVASVPADRRENADWTSRDPPVEPAQELCAILGWKQGIDERDGIWHLVEHRADLLVPVLRAPGRG